jgi:hypothetical protein
VLPQVAAPPPSPAYLANTYSGTPLTCYPFFLYVAPGTHLLPLSYFSPANAVARALRTQCNFEGALKWYRLAFDPFNSDCTWIECPQNPVTGSDGNRSPAANESGGTNTACCDSTNVSLAIARNRSIVLDCSETVRDWGKAATRRNSPEHFQHARLLFDTMELILGKRPLSLQLSEPATPQTVASYTPDFAPLNPRLMDLYDVTRDHLNLIHACTNASRLRNGHPDRDMHYFGNNPLREGLKIASGSCCEEADWCYLHNPYRFSFRIRQAQEHATMAAQISAQLLSAYEKGKAELLAAIRANHDREVLDLQ